MPSPDEVDAPPSASVGDRNEAQRPRSAARRNGASRPGDPDGHEHRADHHELERDEPGPAALGRPGDVAGDGQLRPAVELLPDDVRGDEHDGRGDAARRPPGPQRPARSDDEQRRDAATTATSPTCGLASKPRPTTTPAASIERPAARERSPRTTSQPSAVVLRRSKVVVVTKCPTASAKPGRGRAGRRDQLGAPPAADLARDERREHGRRRRRERRRQPEQEAASPGRGRTSPERSAARAAAGPGTRTRDASRRR